MGKLHTLERAVRRNPKAFMRKGNFSSSYKATAAFWSKRDQEWKPGSWWVHGSYRNFVKSVLRKIREESSEFFPLVH